MSLSVCIGLQVCVGVYVWVCVCPHLAKACRESSCLRCCESSFFSRDRRIQARALPTSVFISPILWMCLWEVGWQRERSREGVDGRRRKGRGSQGGKLGYTLLSGHRLVFLTSSSNLYGGGPYLISCRSDTRINGIPSEDSDLRLSPFGTEEAFIVRCTEQHNVKLGTEILGTRQRKQPSIT